MFPSSPSTLDNDLYIIYFWKNMICLMIEMLIKFINFAYLLPRNVDLFSLDQELPLSLQIEPTNH